MQISADQDPDPGKTFKSQKLNFYKTNKLKVGSGPKNIPAKVQKPF